MDSKMGSIDKIDYEIMNILGEDPRTSFSFIARTLNLDLRTVKRRIKKLQDEGILEFSVSIDAQALGYQSIADIIVEVDPANSSDFIDACMENKYVFFLAEGWGENMFVIQMNCTTNAQLNELVYQVFAKMPGVEIKHIEMIVSVLKDGTRWIPERKDLIGE